MSNLREEFEQWAVNEGYSRERLNDDYPYLDATTAAAWEAWQACYEKHSVENYYKGIMRKAKRMQEEVRQEAKEKRNGRF